MELRCSNCGGNLKYEIIPPIDDQGDRPKGAEKILHCEHCGSNFNPEKISQTTDAAEKNAFVINQDIVTVDGSDLTGLTISGTPPDKKFDVKMNVQTIQGGANVTGAVINMPENVPKKKPAPASPHTSFLERVSIWFHSVFRRR